MLNLIISFILMYLVNELAKNYLKSLFFNFLNVFFVIGAHLGGYHGNKFECLSIIFFYMKHFSKYYKKVSNSKSIFHSYQTLTH